MIIIEPCAGLGNRFIGLASAYHAAKELNQELVVIWKSETVLGAAMDKLFSLPDSIKTEQIAEYGYKLDFFGQIRGNNIKKKYRKMADEFFECDDIMNLYNEKGCEGVKALFDSHKSIYIKATNPFWNIFDIEGAFDFIKPSKIVTDRKDMVLQDARDKKLVSVHIRRTDHIESIKNSPLELFVEKMQSELAGDPDTYFYLATDDTGVEKELKEIFGQRIITFENKSLKRDDEQGIIDAYVEMLCLASGTKILGSFNSTFSLMASKIGNIPLIVVKK